MKKIAVISAALLLALTSCAQAAQETADIASAPVVTTISGDNAETEFRYKADYLPDTDYGGYEFRIVAYDEYPADQQEETGNLINDAIYQRNRLVEEQFGVKISETRYPYAHYGDVYALLKKSALAQSDEYDLYTVVFPNAYSGIIEKVIPAASSLPVIDMSQPWYYKQINDGMEISGITLAAYTAFDKSPGGQLIIFNKRISGDLGLESPYSLVDGGTWTYDRFYSMGRSAVQDMNGDGVMNGEDRFAFIAPIDDITDMAYYGSGLKLVKFGSDVPEVSQDELLYSMFSAMYNFLSQGNILNLKLTAEASSEALKLFKIGHSLFHKAKTSVLTQLGDMEDDYGIVTYPKLSEDQGTYFNGIDGSLIALPCIAASDLERTCVIKEALSVESMNIYYPAYYEISLKNRYVRDEDSIRMLEIVTQANTYDIGAALDYTAIRGPWLDCLEKGKSDFASAVAKNLPKAQKVIDKLLSNIEDIKADIS